MALTSVVLAGGRPDAVARLEPGAPNKAFVRVAGVSLVRRTLAALRESPGVGRIIVVAPESERTRDELPDVELRADGARITDSLRAGLAGLPPDEPVLIAASDLPLLTPQAVDALQRSDFAALAAVMSNDFHEPVLQRYRDVAAAHRTFVAAGGRGAMLSGSGSCLFALFENERAARDCAERARGPAIAATFAVPLVSGNEWR